MSRKKTQLFKNGDFLAVVGSNNEYWLCKCRQHVYEDKTKSFWVQWLEKETTLYKYPAKTTHRKRQKPLKGCQIAQNVPNAPDGNWGCSATAHETVKVCIVISLSMCYLLILCEIISHTCLLITRWF